MTLLFRLQVRRLPYPNKCGDRIMGWTESENHKANTAPADLFTAAPTVQGSKTYYAVFADYAE